MTGQFLKVMNEILHGTINVSVLNKAVNDRWCSCGSTYTIFA